MILLTLFFINFSFANDEYLKIRPLIKVQSLGHDLKPDCAPLIYNEREVKNKNKRLQAELQFVRQELSLNNIDSELQFQLEIRLAELLTAAQELQSQLIYLSDPNFTSEQFKVQVEWVVPKYVFPEIALEEEKEEIERDSARPSKGFGKLKNLYEKDYSVVSSALTRFDDTTEETADYLAKTYGEGVFINWTHPEAWYVFKFAKDMSLIEFCQKLPLYKAESTVYYKKKFFDKFYYLNSQKVLLYVH